jgi:ankyrin repeat protein
MEEEFDIQASANSLMAAIENQNKPELIRIFLEAYYENKLTDLVTGPVTSSARGYNKLTPLSLAISCKVDIDIIHQLINAGADVNEETDYDITPLGRLLSNISFFVNIRTSINKLMYNVNIDLTRYC